MKKLSIVLASILISLGLCEILLRVFGFHFAFYPPGHNGAFVPSDKPYIADSDLFWVPSNYAADLEMIRFHSPAIIFMGDSCTEGPVGDYPERLYLTYGSKPEFGNLPFAKVGVAGWSSYQGLRQLRRDILPLKPKALFFYYGWNDHWDAPGVTDSEIGWVFSRPMQIALKSRLFLLGMKTAVSLGFLNKREDLRRVPEPEFRRNLEAMVNLARENGAVPVLITAPTSHLLGREPEYLQVSWMKELNNLVPIHNRYAEIVREIGRDRGVLVCDLKARFDEIRRNDPAVISSYFLTDGIHFHAEGNQKVAELLYQCVRDAKFSVK